MMMATVCAKSTATVVKEQAPACAHSCARSEVSTNTIWLTMWRPTKRWRTPNGSLQPLSSACVSATVRTLAPHEPSIDREDAVIMAPKLFSVDTEAIKHEAQTDNQHPVFSPVPEQWENATATIQRLQPRYALVKRRNAPA